MDQLSRSIDKLTVEHIICCFVAREENPASFQSCVMSSAARKREIAQEWKSRAAADPALAARMAQLWAEQYRKSGHPGESLDCSRYPDEPETQLLEGTRVPKVLKAELSQILNNQPVERRPAPPPTHRQALTASQILDGQPVKRRPAPPPIHRQALTAVQAAKRWVKKGLALTPPEELERRKAICAGCEFWDSEAFGGTGRCVKCGCSTWAKLQMASESCPVGKWKAV